MNNILKYKDFIATVQFSEEDDTFIGHVEEIDSVVSFEGQSVEELRQAFENAVESYLDFCKRKGIITPKKPYKSVFNVHIHPDLHHRVAITAKMMGTTLDDFVNKAVEIELHEVETNKQRFAKTFVE